VRLCLCELFSSALAGMFLGLMALQFSSARVQMYGLVAVLVYAATGALSCKVVSGNSHFQQLLFLECMVVCGTSGGCDMRTSCL